MTATSAELALSSINETTRRLAVLKHDIWHCARNNSETLGEDDGVEKFYDVVALLHNRVRRVSEGDARRMGADAREALVENLLPFADNIVSELESLWCDIREAHVDQPSVATGDVDPDELVAISALVDAYFNDGGDEAIEKIHTDLSEAMRSHLSD